MVSALWLVVVFVLGGFLGMIVMALMYMSAGPPEQTADVAELRRTELVSDGC